MSRAPNRQIRAGEAGFTLVELLVSLAIAGLLSALVFDGVKLAIRGWVRSQEAVAEVADVWAVESVLRRAISEARPPVPSVHPGTPTNAFDGRADSLTLLAPLPEAVGAAIPVRMTFFLVPDGDSTTLVMAWRLDLPRADGAAAQPEDRVKLLGHLRAIRFEYFGAIEPGGSPVWQASWSGRSGLPSLVRVHLERDRAAPTDLPEVVARPAAAMNAGCLYDPLAACSAAQ